MVTLKDNSVSGPGETGSYPELENLHLTASLSARPPLDKIEVNDRFGSKARIAQTYRASGLPCISSVGTMRRIEVSGSDQPSFAG